MADLALSAVTIERSWSEGGMSNKELSCRRVTMVLSGQGTTTNKIPASVLQLSYIESAGPFITSDNTGIYPAVPSYDGANVLLMNVANVTDANRINPADITATVRGIVKGYL